MSHHPKAECIEYWFPGVGDKVLESGYVARGVGILHLIAQDGVEHVLGRPAGYHEVETQNQHRGQHAHVPDEYPSLVELTEGANSIAMGCCTQRKLADHQRETDDHDRQQIDHQKESEKELEQRSLEAIPEGVLKDMIEKMLSTSNLPITNANIRTVRDTVALLGEVSTLDDSAMSYLLENKLEPTAMNLYKAMHVGANESNKSSGSESDWSEVLLQVEHILKDLEQSGNAITIDEAKWLFSQGLEISSEMVSKYNELKDIKNKLTVSDMIEKVVASMVDAKAATDASMSMKGSNEVKEIIGELTSLTDQHIQYVISQNQPITIRNLSAAKKYIMYTGQMNSFNQEENYSPEVVENRVIDEESNRIDLITARRQLEEVRLKLTYESGVALLKRGIALKTEGLDQIVNHLRALEDTYYKELCMDAGLEGTSAQISQIQSAVYTAQSLAGTSCMVLGSTIGRQTSITLSEFSVEADRLSAKFRARGEAYETLSTAPRGDLGDSIQKAFQSVDHILDELELEHTRANERAVRILGYNEMEITQDSVNEMKLYDFKVNEIIGKLTPDTTVELIRKGINPLEVSMSELSNQIDKIQEELGTTSEEKYSEYLVRLQRNHELTSEQRDAYIGIYRLLNNVNKTDGKAVGMLVKAEREITLKNLLSAVRTIKGNGIDTTIDDSFGALKNLSYVSKNITEQIQSAFTQNTAKESLCDRMTKELLTEFDPSCISNEAVEQTMNRTIESLYETNEMYQQMSPEARGIEYEQILHEIKKAKESKNGIRFLKDHDIPPTLDSIAVATEQFENPINQLQKLKEVLGAESSIHALERAFMDGDTIEQVSTNYQSVVSSISEQLRTRYENHSLTVEDMVQLNGLVSGNKLRSDLVSGNYFQVPLEMNGQTVNLGILLQSTEKGQGNVDIKMDSKEFGAVSAKFTTRNDMVSGLVLCENKSSETGMSHVVDQMKKQLASRNIEVLRIHVGSNAEWFKEYHYEFNENSTNQTLTTNQLLEIAKSFIVGVKEFDQR